MTCLISILDSTTSEVRGISTRIKQNRELFIRFLIDKSHDLHRMIHSKQLSILCQTFQRIENRCILHTNPINKTRSYIHAFYQSYVIHKPESLFTGIISFAIANKKKMDKAEETKITYHFWTESVTRAFSSSRSGNGRRVTQCPPQSYAGCLSKGT